MKKFKFFFKGSQSEKNYLTKQKDKGFILDSVDRGVYQFSKNDQLNNSSLQVEFFEADMETKGLANNNLIKKIVEKDLVSSNYKIIYSYLNENNVDDLNVLNDTKDMEENYLREIRKKFILLYQISTVVFVLLSFMLGMNERTFDFFLIPIFLMFLTWGVLTIGTWKFTKRINSFTNNEKSISPERTVIITYEKERPEIESDLSYLGSWRYSTSKKNSHYYRLSSQFSETQLKNDISSYLDIKEDDVQIISNFGLAPIGYF
ncbi:hypothetical protein [Paraliobacillus salinarum]|uniref:hypothetical protein n=1 Tax=Paraliobacillus salinarum TaxID=1158996 RepID=UPI0015F5B613|nr:hypothetical protein [Paraliobacillus salinarum]